MVLKVDKAFIVRAIRDFAEAEGHEFLSHYSGRGMYGRGCIGIAYHSTAADVSFGLAEQIVSNMLAQGDDVSTISNTLLFLKDASYDSMGRGETMYWRALPVETQTELLSDGIDEQEYVRRACENGPALNERLGEALSELRSESKLFPG
jgi:hypothetical protein